MFATAPALCPACGYATDTATEAIGDARPKPGDWSICLRCSAVNVFDDALRVTAAAPGEYDRLRVTDPAQWQHIERMRLRARLATLLHPIPDRGGKA